jgi:hypothetical protein
MAFTSAHDIEDEFTFQTKPAAAASMELSVTMAGHIVVAVKRATDATTTTMTMTLAQARHFHAQLERALKMAEAATTP